MTANITLLLVVVGFVSNGPNSGEAIRQSAAAKPSDAAATATNPLDQLSAADVAVHVARMVQLDETVAVVNHADSVNAQLSMSPAENSVVSKPQIIATALKSKKDIIAYTAVAGDTVPSLAAKFGVTSDSIRWSNGLSQDSLEAGQSLAIPPVNGIVYVVKPGDTIDSLVQHYNANKQKLIEMNDAEVSGVKPGDRIIMPDAAQPARATVNSAVSFGFSSGSVIPSYGGNGYDYGWCTWHAANRRIQIGRPIPTNLGNAISWYYLAQKSGLPVGTEPQDGAVLWQGNIGGLGHVAFVEKVNDDRSILVSDMNYPVWGRATYRTVQPGEYSSYRFIY